VTYEGSNTFSLYIADTTQGWSHDTTVTVSGAARSSAEVIVEAPCCTGSSGILPLTDFGTINITSSEANGSAIGNVGGLTELIMADNEVSDEDTVSSLGDGENFSATWGSQQLGQAGNRSDPSLIIRAHRAGRPALVEPEPVGRGPAGPAGPAGRAEGSQAVIRAVLVDRRDAGPDRRMLLIIGRPFIPLLNAIATIVGVS